jgi:8-oxo-dGTP diphosphatase
VPERPEVCVAGVALNDGELLMIRRGHGPAGGRWSVPGGRVEHGELLAEAVTREIREETGLECVCGPLLGWVERIDDGPGGTHFVILDFEITVLDPTDPVAGDDAAEVRWVPVDQVVDLPLVDHLAEFLHDHGIIDVIT